jgi:hypothetical protein
MFHFYPQQTASDDKVLQLIEEKQREKIASLSKNDKKTDNQKSNRNNNRPVKPQNRPEPEAANESIGEKNNNINRGKKKMENKGKNTGAKEQTQSPQNSENFKGHNKKVDEQDKRNDTRSQRGKARPARGRGAQNNSSLRQVTFGLLGHFYSNIL